MTWRIGTGVYMMNYPVFHLSGFEITCLDFWVLVEQLLVLWLDWYGCIRLVSFDGLFL